MNTQIKKILLNGKEISMEKGKELVKKYIQDRMGMECFMAGMTINTPAGELKAEVIFNL